MAPPTSAARKDAANARIQAVIDFAAHLHGILIDRGTVPSALRCNLETHIRQIPTLNNAGSGAHARTFDVLGTDLWNAAAPLLDNQVPQPDPRITTSDTVRLGLLVRVFALMLLNTAHSTSSRRAKDQDQQIRVMKVAIRAAKSCLDRTDLEHAHICLEICSQYTRDDEPEPLIQLPSISRENANDAVVVLNMLAAEYYLLRLLHAWRSGRIDLAEHFYPKICRPGGELDADLATKVADVIFELTKSLTRDQKSELAIKWYDRAFTTLKACDVESLSQDAIELFLSIGIALIDHLLVDNHPTARQRAQEVVDLLEKDYGMSNRIVVSLIKFKLLASERQPDPDKISQTLLRLTKLVVLTDDSFKLVMQTVKKAVDVSLETALAVLKSFICTRLVPETRSTVPTESRSQTWLERATISYILYATTRRHGPEQALLQELSELLDDIQGGCGVKFTTKATHASQTLLWKASGTTDLETAYAWIRLLSSTLFEHAGPLNKARICRKLMRTAFEEGNAIVAQDAFNELPVLSQNDPLTRYLAFKLALRTGDENLAMDSLKIVMKVAKTDPTCLYACVLEAQQSESRPMAVAALQAILDERPAGLHLPSLLRCTARLLISELDVDGYISDKLLLELLSVLETAAKCVDEMNKVAGEHWRSEVQWWSKNTYNLAIRLSNTVDPDLLVRLLDVCTTFLDRYPNDLAKNQHERVSQRKSICAFLATTALIVLGRSGSTDVAGYTAQCFLHAEQRIDAFKAARKRVNDGFMDEHVDARTFAMLKFELECVLRLEKWDRLSDTLKACLNAQSVGRWDTLADLVIIVHERLDDNTKRSNAETMTKLLQRMINDTWRRDKDMIKVARWVRFTFTLCLGHSPGSFNVQLLEQAANIAEAGDRGNRHRYPECELQWLATTSFNHAIDLLINEEEESALSWMDSALALARWSSDNGSLHASFTGKREIALARARGHCLGKNIS